MITLRVDKQGINISRDVLQQAHLLFAILSLSQEGSLTGHTSIALIKIHLKV